MHKCIVDFLLFLVAQLSHNLFADTGTSNEAADRFLIFALKMFIFCS